MSEDEKTVRAAFPDSEWEWWHTVTPTGARGYMAVVYTKHRTLLGSGESKSLTKAKDLAYLVAVNHDFISPA